ncbi:MAG: hypothetical protein SNJ55_12800 [Chloroherpetonaceae bacterium]
MKKTSSKKTTRIQRWLKQAELTRQKGEQLYHQRFKQRLEPTHNNKIVCINCETEDFVMGKTVLDALEKAEAKYPNTFFHIRRVGFPAVYSLNGVYDFKQI